MERRLLAASLLCFGFVLAAAAAPPPPATEILQVIDRQQAAWNRGDLEAFMAGYWKSPDLTFYSGGKASQGWQDTLDGYKARYQGEGREMGKLEFSDLSVHFLDPNSAWVGGHWRLMMSKGDNPGGLFTLIFRRFPDGWKIIHDHTSSE